VVVFALGAPVAGAETKRYEGSEAAALRCAHIMALTAVLLSDTEMIGEAEREVMLGISFLILDSHVSGTWAQKKAALEVVRDRRSVAETLDDFQRLAQKCLRDFPIN
jgi:hypothetical protein